MTRGNFVPEGREAQTFTLQLRLYVSVLENSTQNLYTHRENAKVAFRPAEWPGGE